MCKCYSSTEDKRRYWILKCFAHSCETPEYVKIGVTRHSNIQFWEELGY